MRFCLIVAFVLEKLVLIYTYGFACGFTDYGLVCGDSGLGTLVPLGTSEARFLLSQFFIVGLVLG
jgi:hypothetical protein